MIGVLTGPLDVVGRVIVVARHAQRTVDEIEKAIEAYRRPPEGGRIEGSHSHILLRATWIRGGRTPCPAPVFAGPCEGAPGIARLRDKKLERQFGISRGRNSIKSRGL